MPTSSSAPVLRSNKFYPFSLTAPYVAALISRIRIWHSFRIRIWGLKARERGSLHPFRGMTSWPSRKRSPTYPVPARHTFALPGINNTRGASSEPGSEQMLKRAGTRKGGR